MIRWLVRRVLALFGAVRTRPPDDVRHKATLERADRLIRVAHDYAKADASRREHR